MLLMNLIKSLKIERIENWMNTFNLTTKRNVLFKANEISFELKICLLLWAQMKFCHKSTFETSGIFIETNKNNIGIEPNLK